MAHSQQSVISYGSDGLQFFAGRGLEKLNAPRSSRVRRQQHRLTESALLFSDLNQWMLKVLLAPLIPEGLLHAPREQYRNASQLVEAFRILGLSAQNPGPANEILNRYRA